MKRGTRPPRGLDLRPERLHIPSPKLIEEEMIELEHRALSVRENYRWLHGVVLSVQNSENAGRRSSAPSKPTESAAMQPKSSLLSSYERVLDAHAKLREAESLLLRELNRYDPPQTPVAWSRVTVRKVELEAYHEAAQRRRSRGEHIP